MYIPEEFSEELTKVLNELESSNFTDEEKFTQAQNLASQYRVFIMSLPKEERSVHKTNLRGFRSRILHAKQEIQWAERYKVRNKNINMSENENENELISHGRRIQNDTEKCVERQLATINKTKEIAVQISNKVQSQTEQLQVIDNEVYKIDDMLSRSVAIMKVMGRRVASQKYLWVMIFLIVAGIVAIIVVNTS